MPPPRILVAYASRHEATAEIAAAIAAELEASGCSVELSEVGAVHCLAGFDAAVVGSAVYLAKWDRSAVELVRRERTVLGAMPTWLFSSGPVGTGSATARPERLPQPDNVAALAEEIGAHATTFGGRVAPAGGGFDMEILATAGLAGDWRNFARIRRWARAIAAEVVSSMAATGAEAAEDVRP
jgi:menaquinone-dependent protoporphyrinogen oxidase